MSSHTWACFDCRLTVRRPSDHRGDVRCPECAEDCRYLGYKLRVPSRRDPEAWAKLLDSLRAADRAKRERDYRASVRGRHATERRIEELERREPNPERERLVRRLRRRIEGD